MGNSGCLPLGKVSCNRVALQQPTVHAGCFSVSTIHRTLTWTTGSLKCTQMLMHVNAHGGVQTHVRESARKVDSGRIFLAAPGNQTCISGMTVWCSTNELHPHLSLCLCLSLPLSLCFCLFLSVSMLRVAWSCCIREQEQYVRSLLLFLRQQHVLTHCCSFWARSIINTHAHTHTRTHTHTHTHTHGN